MNAFIHSFTAVPPTRSYPTPGLLIPTVKTGQQLYTTIGPKHFDQFILLLFYFVPSRVSASGSALPPDTELPRPSHGFQFCMFIIGVGHGHWVAHSIPGHPRPIGRPHLTWMDTAMHDMGSLGRTLQIDLPPDWASLALHRDVWRGVNSRC